MTEPDRGPIERMLAEVVASVSALDGGQVADYIPELAKADPATTGLSLATLDGAVYEVGDMVPFTIQSVSKPFVYALALADSGSDAVLAKVGAEPTGDPFNSISIDDVSCRAHNPMVNAGAIVTATMVAGDTRRQQFERIHSGLSAFAGRTLDIDDDVFRSEEATGDRNRAIAYLMRSVGLLEEDVEAQVSMYFRQCAVLVTARDLAVMAATLANAGVNPVTGEQVVPRDIVAPVLTVMSTCGMYDYAGEWLYRVGLPAKSGVSGAVAASLPGQLGLAAHSPRLDARGNSVRGVAACEALSRRLGLHLLLPAERSRPGLRRTLRGDSVRSRHNRLAAEREILAAEGGRIVVHELDGDQGFASVEALLRQIAADPQPAGWRVLDLARVTRIDAAAAALLAGLVAEQAGSGVVMAAVEPRLREVREHVGGFSDSVRFFPDSDRALEWCETALLRGHGDLESVAERLTPLAEQDLLRDLDEETVARLAEMVTTKVFTEGTVVFNEGDEPDGIYFIGAGLVIADVFVRGRRERRRLSSVSAGSAFGELALVDGRTRSTRIVAHAPTICYVLSPERFASLQELYPQAAAGLTLAIARGLSERLRSSTAEVAALESA